MIYFGKLELLYLVFIFVVAWVAWSAGIVH
jgi:hypothetical protein